MREPIPQPLTIDGALVSVRNAPLLLAALGFTGLIVMWSGSLGAVPAGWALCDGTNGTPDLRDRFIAGARGDYGGVPKSTLEGEPKQTGGSVTHTHTFTTNGHTHGTKSGGPFEGSLGTIDIVNAKDSGTTDGPNTVPVPYFTLAFIMKL
jgi:hypothetical protein